ncbi:NmrA family NAD(P)-binding protein [Pedobacter agri]|uniref:NmrA family NAD(P)-binding protein n=1 Tax=Pedobacter agri TaxID=454586 RepID=UPI00292CE8DF|nr:NmrA family NAD(P)-binding protein [Pedobacter agri]
MKKIILVAGASGNLGGRICRELIKRGGRVRAAVRHSADPEKSHALIKMGLELIEVDYNNASEIENACKDVNCVVSALAGLSEVIIDLQKRLLDASLSAGVPRFIPSDFCTDYTKLVAGENRNFDLRRQFRDILDRSSIKACSIFNGAFADILKYNTPVFNLKDKSISFWGDRQDWKLDFTTMDNTAEFTAEAAMDDQSPRALHIASFQVSPKKIHEIVGEVTGREFKLQQLSSLGDFAETIQKLRTAYPAGEHELYAKWQQAQYMYSMFTTQHPKLDNTRYSGISWTPAAVYINSFAK